MKTLYPLLFFINLITFTNKTMIVHNIWIKTKDKKIIELTYPEACHSSYISECNRLSAMLSSKKYPLKHDEIKYKKLEQTMVSLKLILQIKKKAINVTAKELLSFKKIIHRPALYSEMEHTRYIKALNIAEKMQAPILYAELLKAKLPHQVLALIVEKYKQLSDVNDTLHDIIGNKLFTFWNKVRYTLDQRYNQLQKEQSQLAHLLKNITLPQLVLLDMLCHTSLFNNYPVLIISHMPGFNDLELLDNNYHKFILDYFAITINSKPNKKKLPFIYSFIFKV